jgi:hypothetical protein
VGLSEAGSHRKADGPKGWLSSSRWRTARAFARVAEAQPAFGERARAVATCRLVLGLLRKDQPTPPVRNGVPESRAPVSRRRRRRARGPAALEGSPDRCKDGPLTGGFEKPPVHSDEVQ